MNDDHLAAFVRHVTHRPVPNGASQAELLDILARRYELLEYAIVKFQEQLTAVMASVKAVLPPTEAMTQAVTAHTTTDVPPEFDQSCQPDSVFVCGGFNCPVNDYQPCPDPNCKARKDTAEPSTT
jgi:hypothetical protein